VEGRFLQLIVSLSGFRDVVDIGTFTGYSALAMAASVPPDGEKPYGIKIGKTSCRNSTPGNPHRQKKFKKQVSNRIRKQKTQESSGFRCRRIHSTRFFIEKNG